MQRLVFLDRSSSSPELLLDLSNWVDDLSQDQLERLCQYFQPYTAATGTVILQEGEAAGFFCLICDGAVDVMKENTLGKLKKLGTLNKGKIFGEMAFFDRVASSTHVIVKHDAVLLMMDERHFAALSTEFPQLALKITIKLLRTVSYRLRQTSGQLIDLI